MTVNGGEVLTLPIKDFVPDEVQTDFREDLKDSRSNFAEWLTGISLVCITSSLP